MLKRKIKELNEIVFLFNEKEVKDHHLLQVKEVIKENDIKSLKSEDADNYLRFLIWEESEFLNYIRLLNRLLPIEIIFYLDEKAALIKADPSETEIHYIKTGELLTK